MTTTTGIEPLLERVLAGGALAAGERDALVASRDLLTLGMAADELRQRRHGRQVTFVRVAAVSVERAAAGDATWGGSPGEVRLTGSPADLAQAVAAVTAVAGAAGVPVTGFSLDDLARQAGDAASLTSWLRSLRQAGLAAVADAPIDRLEAPGPALASAAGAGLPVARLTIDRAPGAQRGALLALAADLVGAFPALDVFAPLPQRPDAGAAASTGYDDVQLVALARLLVPVSHIQVDWQRYGPKLAQVALTFGADDVDGVSPLDDVAEGRRRSPLEEIRRNIQAAAADPVERTALFGRR